MPLRHCYFHPLRNKHLLLLQGTSVYIDPDTLSPLKIIEWAHEQKKISSTEQLAFTHFLNSEDQNDRTKNGFNDRINDLKSEKEKWSYHTCEGLSDPASRMHDNLINFRNSSNIDAQIAFDQIGIVFNQTDSGLSAQRTATVANDKGLKELISWFEERMNLLVTFLEFPEEETDQNLHDIPGADSDELKPKQKNEGLT